MSSEEITPERPPRPKPDGSWSGSTKQPPRQFVCHYCDNMVASKEGWKYNVGPPDTSAYVCPYCSSPSFFIGECQIPSPCPGKDVDGIAEVEVRQLYWEARASIAAGAYTAGVMACRKLLMNIAVAKGAGKNKGFVYYVDYLAESGHVPIEVKPLLAHIRAKGNDANHEIRLMRMPDALQILCFTEMLLTVIYQVPQQLADMEQPPADAEGFTIEGV